MDTIAGQRDVLVPLSQWLDSRGPLDFDSLARLLRQLATQLAQMHDAGQLHGRVSMDAVMVGEGDTFQFQSQADAPLHASLEGEFCPPELSGRRLPEVPLELVAASAALSSPVEPYDARRIDVYQWAVLAVHVATGSNVEDYLRSPRASAKMPVRLRPTVDRALGFSASLRLETCQQVLDKLATAIQRENSQGRETPSQGVILSTADTDFAKKAERQRRESRAEDLPFTKLGPYEIVSRLGSGGMGDVYKGYDPSLDRFVAIKVLPAELTRHEDFVTRFRAEATAAAKVEHPNIVPIYTIGADQGHYYFAMQLVAGPTLGQLLAEQFRLPLDKTLSVVRQVLQGLAAAHRQGLVHRDIKPGNILLGDNGQRALLADFGLAKIASPGTRMTATGVIMGTVDYISPEQGRGKAVDARSDLYSIGVLMYQMLAGRLPFEADSPTAMIFQHAYEPAAPLIQAAKDIPSTLAAVVHRLMAKSPDDRYQTCEDLLEDLEAIHDGRPLPHLRSAGALRQRTAIITAPRFDEPALQDLPEVAVVASGSWSFSEVYQRALLWLGRQAPDVVRRWQNTQQQVDGAVFEYEERCRSLARLVADAEDVQRLLNEQCKGFEGAAVDAQRRREQASDDLACQEAESDRLASEAAAAELRPQLEQQREELESMQLAHAKASAKLARLKGQRDALNARLQVAHARYGLAHARPRTRPLWRIAAGIGVIAVVLASASAVWMRLSGPSKSVSNTDPTRQPAGKSSSDAPVEWWGKKVVLSIDPSGQEAVLPLRGLVMRFDAERNQPSLFIGGEDGSLLRVPLKKGAILLDSVVQRFDHQRQIDCLAFDGVNGRLASGSTDGEIVIWDRQSNREYRRLSVGQDVRDVAFSPDGTQLLSASDGGVRLWDVASGEELERFTGLPISDSANAVAWLPDGTGFVEGLRLNIGKNSSLSASAVYRVSFDGSSPLPLEAHNTASDLQTINGGEFIVGRSPSGISVWNAKDGSLRHRFAEGVRAVAYSPRGQLVLTGQTDGAIILWNTQTAQKIDEFGKLPETVTALAISADGRYGAATDGRVLRIFSLPGETIPHLKAQSSARSPIVGLSISPVDYLAVSASQEQVRVWKLAGDFTNFELSGAAPAAAAAVSDDGSRLLVARGKPDREGFGPIILFDKVVHAPSRPRELRRYAGHRGGTTALQFVSSGRRIVSAGNDQFLRLWETGTEEQLSELDAGDAIHAFAATRDGNTAVILTNSVDCDVWDLQTKQRVGNLKGHTLTPRTVAIARKTQRAATAGSDRTVRVWDLATRESVVVFECPAPINCVQLTPDGRIVVAGSQDGTLRVWNVEGQQLLDTWTAHSGPISALTLSPDGRTMLSAGVDLNVAWWDIPNEKQQ